MDNNTIKEKFEASLFEKYAECEYGSLVDKKRLFGKYGDDFERKVNKALVEKLTSSGVIELCDDVGISYSDQYGTINDLTILNRDISLEIDGQEYLFTLTLNFNGGEEEKLVIDARLSLCDKECEGAFCSNVHYLAPEDGGMCFDEPVYGHWDIGLTSDTLKAICAKVSSKGFAVNYRNMPAFPINSRQLRVAEVLSNGNEIIPAIKSKELLSATEIETLLDLIQKMRERDLTLDTKIDDIAYEVENESDGYEHITISDISEAIKSHNKEISH